MLRSSSASATRTTSPAGGSPLARELRERDGAGRELALHVGGAAADQRGRRAPRPRTAGRSSRRRGAGTTSVWAISISDGPSPRPRHAGDEVEALGVGADQLALGPGLGQVARRAARRPASRCPAGWRCRSGSARCASSSDLLAEPARQPPARSAASPRTRSIGKASCIVPSRRSAGSRGDEAVEDRLVGGLVGGGEERRSRSPTDRWPEASAGGSVANAKAIRSRPSRSDA